MCAPWRYGCVWCMHVRQKHDPHCCALKNTPQDCCCGRTEPGIVWHHLDGTPCVAGWLATTGECAEGGGPVTPRLVKEERRTADDADPLICFCGSVWFVATINIQAGSLMAEKARCRRCDLPAVKRHG